MLDFYQMTIRFLIALALGALIGWERGLIGKEAGIRTLMLVSGGASLFTMAALALPYLVALPGESIERIIEGSTFMNIISSIVVGIGFLGGGIIIKTENHVHGLTSAALVWTTAAVGVFSGIGLISFAVFSGVVITILLYLLRNLRVRHISD